ncbi:MAG: 50S ribosomal protein L23 [Candidatus Omnitrophica bacterium]|nr:50S ribosomal protein L23 [Candidatus Omnitrophota bacterium]
MNYSQDIVKSLMRTEKSTQYEPDAKYLFLVDLKANKIQIKRAVEQLYKVKVKGVNTFVSSGKLKRVRHQLGRTPETKKAVVTLQAGQKIEVA